MLGGRRMAGSIAAVQIRVYQAKFGDASRSQATIDREPIAQCIISLGRGFVET